MDELQKAREQVGVLSFDILRPRLYKAIGAAVFEAEEPEARSAFLTQWLKELMVEVPHEPTLPEELVEAQKSALQAGWQRAVNRCRRLAGQYFDWEAAQTDWVRELKKAVARVAQDDEASAAQPLDSPLETLMLHSLRQRWCGEAHEPEIFLMGEWLKEVGFFPRKILEIGSWARLFRTVASLYREGEAAPALRHQIFQRLLEKIGQGHALASIPEVMIYLEGETRAKEMGETFSVPMPPPLEPDVFFPGQDLEAVLQVIREALEFLLTNGHKPIFQNRLQWLEEHREFIDLRDLLCAFLGELLETKTLPAASQVLEDLQRQGYPILHKDFRDEYRAWMAPLSDLARASAAKLRLPLDPTFLSGEATTDLVMETQREESRRIALLAFQEGALAFIQGNREPLPRSEVVRPAISFAVAWSVAPCLESGKFPDAETLSEAAAGLLAPPLLRLVRPRKGYELKHKSELQIFLREEARTYLAALARWRRQGRIVNLYDDTLLYTLASARVLQQETDVPGDLTEAAVHHLSLIQVNSALTESASRLEVDLAPAGTPWWQEFQDWLREKLDWPSFLKIGEELKGLEEAWQQEATALLQKLARQCYRQVVAMGRQERNLPCLAGDPALLPWFAAWFTPLSQSLKEHVNRELLVTLQERAYRSLWESIPLRVESREELISLIRYWLSQELKGQDLETYARHGRLSELTAREAERLANVIFPLDIALPGGYQGAVQEVLRPRAPEAIQEQRRLEETVLALLPRSDCGSCGAPGCLAFSRLLVRGQTQVAQCLQASIEIKGQLEELLATTPTAALMLEPYVLTEEDLHRLGYLLDPYFMTLRDWVAQEIQGPEAQRLVPIKLDEISILQIGKSPDAETFHRYVEDYLGVDAAQTLSDRDRAFLVEYGDFRLAAEEKSLEDSFSWLERESRRGLSVFALSPRDPAFQARQAYATVLFLGDLAESDRRKVQEFRLREYLDDFLADWERALVDHWQAGYRIEDWEDFAQILTKSFWHQEHTPAPGEIMREMPSSAFNGRQTEVLKSAYLEKLVRQEAETLQDFRQRLEALLHHRGITSMEDLKILIQGLVTQARQNLRATGPSEHLPGESPLNRTVKTAFELFNQANLNISGELRIFQDDLSFRTRELLTENLQIPPTEVARLEGAREGLAWRELHAWQAELLKVLMQGAVEQLLKQEHEVGLFQRGECPLITPRILRLATRQVFWSGQRGLSDLLESLEAILDNYPEGRTWLIQEALRDVIWERLRSGAFSKTEADAGPFIKSLDQSLRAQHAHDIQKLKAYMYLLARLEGDLDRLTALLREIRETSDIIEAAWLAFTEERAAQPPAGAEASAPDAPFPLLASRLKDMERLNRYLLKGLPRGEPREYSQAYWELITLLQFYVVTAHPEDPPEEMYRRLAEDKHDLGGLSQEAVLFALNHQAQHRQRLLKRKISICTEVLANRLAQANPHLAQTAAAFLQKKGTLLKEESLSAEHQKGQVAAARGVDLAKVKNELYVHIAELLTDERTESFTRRIGQIIDRLEEERRETLAALQRGELNRLTVFYILRRYQKDQKIVPSGDLCRFLRRYQPEVLGNLKLQLCPEVRQSVEQRLEEIMSSYKSALTA